MHGRSRMNLDPRIPTTMPGDEARRVFTNQADIDIASTKREVPWSIFGVSHEG